MTRRFEAVIQISASPGEVWRVLTDLASWERWNTVVPRRPRQQLAEGGRFPLRLSVAGLRVPARARLVRVEPERALVWRGGVGGLFTAEHGFELEGDGQITALRHFEVFRGVLKRPVLALLGPYHAQMYERVARALAEQVTR